MNIFFETDRLILREIEVTDLEGFFELDSDPEVHKYLGNRPVQNRDESLKIIESVRKQYKNNNIGRWAIIDKKTGEFVGWTGLKYEKNFREIFEYYDLGYRLKRKFWGKGIATETAKLSLKYGFEIMKLNDIFAAAHTENIASNTILLKVGFKFIQTFNYYDAIHNWYKIERETWLKKNEIEE